MRSNQYALYRFSMLWLVLLIAFLPTGVQAAPPGQDPIPTVDAGLKAEADQLYVEAKALYDASRFQDAITTLARAIELYRQAGDRPSEQLSLFRMGSIHYRIAEYEKALEYFQPALDLARSLGDQAGEAGILSSIGVMYRRLLRYNDATAVYEQALTISRTIADRILEANVVNNLGMIDMLLGRYREAQARFDEALQIERELNDTKGMDATLTNIGELHYKLGQYAQSLETDQQVLALRRTQNDRAGQSIILNNIGRMYAYLNEYAYAMEAYQASRNLLIELRDRITEGLTVGNIGRVYLEMGQYDQAQAAYAEALGILREVGDRKVEGRTLEEVGKAYQAMNNLAQAQETYQQALDIALELNDVTGVVASLSDLGGLASDRGDQAGALEYLTRAYGIAKDKGVWQEGEILNRLGLVYHRLGQEDQAVERLEAAQQIAAKLENRMGESEVLATLGSVYEAQGNLTQALAAYAQAAARLESVRTAAGIEEFKISVAAKGSEIYQRSALVLQELNQPSQSFAWAERGRARAFLDQLGNARLAVRSTADADLLAQESSLRQEVASLEQDLRDELAKPASQQSSEIIASLRAQIDTRQQAYSSLLTQIKLTDPESSSLVDVEPLSLQDTQKLLDPQTTLLAYFVTPTSTLAYVVTQDALQTVLLPVTQRELEDAVNEFRSFASLDTVPPPSLVRLYAWLIAPLRSHLKTPLLGIIPHGVLHNVPFAALAAVENEPRYLSDDFVLFSLPSASALPYVQEKRKTTAGSMLAVGLGQAEGQPPLHYAEEEAQAIAQLYGTTALVGRQATETAWRKQVTTARIIHLAAHGQLNRTNPLFSRLVLWPGSDTDGFVEVHEVYQLNLAQADLVTLSACETQLGARSQGDDIVGLNRAFIYAGAPSVIASLWRVDDQATGLLMRTFYAQLQHGRGKAEALQAAQQIVRETYPHPYYWSSFVLTGDPSPRLAAPAPTTSGAGMTPAPPDQIAVDGEAPAGPAPQSPKPPAQARLPVGVLLAGTGAVLVGLIAARLSSRRPVK
jgi:CHAT domain-containing protein/Tfp pilus assembly protein PilF